MVVRGCPRRFAGIHALPAGPDTGKIEKNNAENRQGLPNRYDRFNSYCRAVDAVLRVSPNAVRCVVAFRKLTGQLNTFHSKSGSDLRSQLALSLMAFCFLCPGCGITDSLIKTVVIQPAQYCNYFDEKHQQHHFRKLAREVLEQEKCAARAALGRYTCEPFSVDEELGFEDGFVDHVMYGGTINSAPLPPRRYWGIKYQNPQGFRAMEDWFRGYQHGAAVAEAGGYREFVTIPLNDSLTVDTLPVYYPDQHLSFPIMAPDALSDEIVPESTQSGQPAAASDEPAAPENWSRNDLPSSGSSEWTNPLSSWRDAPSAVSEFENLPDQQPSTATEPVATRPAHRFEASPSTFKPATTQVVIQPAMIRPVANQFESSRSETIQPETIQPETIQPETSQPETTQPETTQPETTQPETSQPETTQPETTQPETTQPETTQPETIQLETSQPETSQPEATQPEAIQPETAAESAQPLQTRPATIRRLPSTASQALPDPRSSRFSPGQPDPMARRLPTSDTGKLPDAARISLMIPEPSPQGDVALASCSDIEPAIEEDVMDWSSQLDAPVPGRWPGLVVILVLVAGMIFRFRNRSSNIANLPQPLPTDQPRRLAGRYFRRISRHGATKSRWSGGQPLVVLAAVLSCLTTGCASLTNPVQNGIPVRRLPDELLATPRREGLQTIPLSLLRRQQPEDYILAAGDVIGVFVAGVFPLTLADQALPAPPVYFPSQIDPLGAGLPPSTGYPVTIRNDGKLALPLVEPVLLEGLTVEQASERVRDAYVDAGILQPGRESVLVTLMQPRQVRVLLFRQELGGFATGGRGDIATNGGKLGTGHLVDLRAYENDVLTAMAKTGGLPGLDAFDGIYIFRGAQSNAALTETLESIQSAEELSTIAEFGVPTDYIPTRWAPGEPLPFGPEDIILEDGDVVLLEARSKDFFYTGGLLPAGERVLPRDYDLDVVEAVTQITGTLVNGAFGGNNFTGRLIQQGIGNPNPSALTVIRRTPSGGQVPIKVDLNRALVDPRERILIQPDDVLILQETTDEALARYVTDVFNFNVFLNIYRGSSGAGSAGFTQVPAVR